MAKIQKDQPLLPSLLDRLLDDEPTKQREAPKSRAQLLRDLKQSVRRDLEDLLNTRWRCETWPADLDQLDTSLVNYGIPDFAGVNMSLESERKQLRKTLEQTLQKFEPRFKRVKVTLLENKDKTDRTLRFRIDALIYAEPAPEPVVFESQLDPATTTFDVKSVDR